jgi:hypothetical protein
MKRGHSNKEIWFEADALLQIPPLSGQRQESEHHALHQQQHSHHHRAAQQKCGARQPERIALPAAHQQKDNPTQQLIKQAVDFLLQQLEAGKSETLDRVSRRNGPVPFIFFWEHFSHCETTPFSDQSSGVLRMEGVGPVCEARREGYSDSRPDGRTAAQEGQRQSRSRTRIGKRSPRPC